MSVTPKPTGFGCPAVKETEAVWCKSHKAAFLLEKFSRLFEVRFGGEVNIRREAINAQRRPLVMFADTAVYAQNKPTLR